MRIPSSCPTFSRIDRHSQLLAVVHKCVSIFILVAFVGTSIKTPAYAQMAQDPFARMPAPGVMVHLSPEFTPAYLKALIIHPENALRFDFIVTRGDEPLNDRQKHDTYQKLIKYFLASLAVPDENQWVNLSPYEKERIIKDDFGKTEMGRDLLAQDYLLKQITASLIYPESNLGRKFWDRIYSEAYKQFGTTNIPVNTFNKVWIIPDSASVYEHGNMVYVVNQHLKVMLEEDYLSFKKHSGISSPSLVKEGVKGSSASAAHSLASQIIRAIVLPDLEKEVNTAKNFAVLRQVYSGMILAAWYKHALKGSLLGKIYANKDKIKGVDQDPKNNQEIYQRYLKAFKKGVFNYIKEDMDRYTNETIPRKYFSGGTVNPGEEGYFNEGIVHPVGLAMVAEDMAKTSEDDALIYLVSPANPAMTTDVVEKQVSVKMDTPMLFRGEDGRLSKVNLGKPNKTPKQYFRYFVEVDPSKRISLLIPSLFRGHWVCVNGDPYPVSPGQELDITKSLRSYEMNIISEESLVPGKTIKDTSGLELAMKFETMPKKEEELHQETNLDRQKVLSKKFTDQFNSVVVIMSGQGESGELQPDLKITLERELRKLTLDRKIIPSTVLVVVLGNKSHPDVNQIIRDLEFRTLRFLLKRDLGDKSNIDTSSYYYVEEGGRGSQFQVLNDLIFNTKRRSSLVAFGGDKFSRSDITALANNGLNKVVLIKKLVHESDIHHYVDDLTLDRQLTSKQNVWIVDPNLTKTNIENQIAKYESDVNTGRILAVSDKVWLGSVRNVLPALETDLIQRIDALQNAAMASTESSMAIPIRIDQSTPSTNNKGGIDMNPANLNLQIKRDGKGVPLPISQQDLENIHLDGLVPMILEIKPAMASSLLSDLHQ